MPSPSGSSGFRQCFHLVNILDQWNSRDNPGWLPGLVCQRQDYGLNPPHKLRELQAITEFPLGAVERRVVGVGEGALDHQGNAAGR